MKIEGEKAALEGAIHQTEIRGEYAIGFNGHSGTGVECIDPFCHTGTDTNVLKGTFHEPSPP